MAESTRGSTRLSRDELAREGRGITDKRRKREREAERGEIN